MGLKCKVLIVVGTARLLVYFCSCRVLSRSGTLLNATLTSSVHIQVKVLEIVPGRTDTTVKVIEIVAGHADTDVKVLETVAGNTDTEVKWQGTPTWRLSCFTTRLEASRVSVQELPTANIQDSKDSVLCNGLLRNHTTQKL